MAQSNTLEFILKLTDQASKDLQGFAKNVEGVTKGLSETGEGLIKLGAAGAAGLALATKASMDFDTQLRNIQSISKSTEEEIQGMGDTFVRLSKQLPQSATQLAEGFYNIQSSGFAGSDALKVLEASAKAASAGLTTTENSSKAITAALNAYGMSANDAKMVSDTLFKTVDIGVVSFEELSGTIGDVLGTASNMTVSVQEVGAAIATMTKKGINASEATTALNATILSFMKPSEGMASVLKKLGYESGQAALEHMTLGEALMAVTKEGEKSGVSVTDLFGNVRALKGVLAITSDGAKGFSNDLQAMQTASDGAGASQLAFEQQAKGAAFQAKIFQNNIEAIGLALRTTLLPAINEAMAKIVPIIQKFADFASEHPKLITGILGIGAAMVALGTGLVIIGQVVGAFANIANGVGVLLKIVPAITSAFGVIQSAVMGLTAFLMANPIVLVIVAIVAAITFLALAWKNNWFDIRGKTQAVVDWIGNKLSELGTWFQTSVVQPIQNMVSAVGEAWNTFTTQVTNTFNAIITTITTFVTNAVTAITEFWYAIVNNPVVVTLVEWVSAIFNAIAAVITGVLAVIGAIIFNTFSFIFAVISAIMQLIWDDMVIKWNAIVAVVTVVLEVLKTVIDAAWAQIVIIFQTYVQPLIDWLVATWGNFVTWITAAFETIKTNVINAWNLIRNTIMSIVTPLVAWLQERWEAFKTFLQVTHDAIKTTITNAWNAIKTSIISLVNQALDPVKEKWNAFKENLISGAQQLWEKIVDMANRIKAALQSIKFPHLSIGEGTVSVGGKEVKYPTINVDWYKNGGWVDNTGLAVVHQGEFVMSKNMLEGKQPIPGNLNTTNNSYSSPVYVTAIVNNEMDVVQMAHLIGYELDGGRY